MKRSSTSKKTKTTVTIIIIVLLIIAIIAILFFTNKNIVNSKQTEEVQEQEVVQEEQNEVTEEDTMKEEQQPEKTNEQTEEVNPEASKEESVEVSNGKEDGNDEDKNSNESDVIADDNGYIVGQTLPSEPTYIKGVLIANKKYPLPKDYNPGESVEARAAFDEMAQAALKEGYKITAFSTFRSFDYQTTLYNRYVERDGKNNADRYSARPGYSEHQTGLGFDVGEVGREDLWLTSEFGETEVGKWLVANAHNYGFILRYPEGKEHITGYMYESWHFRYLGKQLATEVKASGLTLEEFLGIN
ncbi:MAG TPA: M15 family metallopeptidase [Ureibacillus sp.]|nr:M15 family metallopeptidase [Ureibacillus sp.]